MRFKRKENVEMRNICRGSFSLWFRLVKMEELSILLVRRHREKGERVIRVNLRKLLKDLQER